MIRVNEIFPTIQGEGRWCGTPATFIRLQGCAVGCPWCDTKHTWRQPERKRVDLAAMIAKEDSSPTWAEASAGALALLVGNLPARHYVITGGEPCEQDIYELTVLLGREGRVQIETSGTRPINVAIDTWVTLSPKIAMPGGLDLVGQALDRADEIKMPVATERDVKVLLGILDHRRKPLPLVALQPISQGDEATALCIRHCIARNWNLSLQTHKYASVR